ncbi:MAG: transporter [Bacteroidetes bacterium]|jgi:ACS family hexuronate transporter-like MFS transporter|nr:transporter [Bacteroidota bacterium]
METPASNSSGRLFDGNYRWVICALLFFATTVNYIDRQILSLLKPILDEELGWTNEQFGLINSAFQGAYGIGLLVFGWFIDRFGTKIGYAVSIAAWSVAAIAHAFVGSVGGFLGARIALGLGEGGNFPSAIKAVALWFPKKERAFATSIFNAGTNVGAIIAPAIVPWLAFTWGWQSAFIAAGIAGFLWLLLWIPFYDIPEKIKRLNKNELAFIHSDADEQGVQNKVSWGSLLRYRQTWAFLVAKGLTDPIWWFFLIWLPDYFKQTRGLDIKSSWIHLVTIYAIVTVLSIMGGWVTGYMAKRGWTVTRARKTGMFFFALCVIPIYFVTTVGDWTAVLLIGLAGAAHQAWSANLFTTVSDMFPKHAIASVTGIGGMAGAGVGMLFPFLTGKLLDAFKASGDITGGYAILFAICAFAYVFTFVIHHLLAPKFELFELKKG